MRCVFFCWGINAFFLLAFLGCMGWCGRSSYIGRHFIIFVKVFQYPSNLPRLTASPVFRTADEILNIFVGINFAIRTLSSHGINMLQGLALFFFTKDPTTITANTSTALVVSIYIYIYKFRVNYLLLFQYVRI